MKKFVAKSRHASAILLMIGLTLLILGALTPSQSVGNDRRTARPAKNPPARKVSPAATLSVASPSAPNCTLPGVQVQSDAANDQTGNQAGVTPQLDLHGVWIAELGTETNTITFTLKVANLTGGPQTNSTWAVFMNVADTTGVTRNIFFNMNTVDSPTGAVGFNYGYHEGNSNTSQGAGSVITGSSNPDGTITLKVNTANILSFNDIASAHVFDVDLTQPGVSLIGIQGQTTLFLGAIGFGATITTDSTTQGTGTYLTIGNAACVGATPTPTPTPTATPTPTPTPGTAGPPRFFNYYAPLGIGENAGEPTIGSNWKTEQTFSNSLFSIPNGGTTMYFGGFMTAALKVTFSDCSSPATATWDQKALTGPNAPRVFGDPILFTDPQTGRTFVSQLLGLTPGGSTTDITDDDGETFTPSEGSSLPSDVDHQTFGGGPLHAPLTRDPNGPIYPNAVYYASQSIADARAAVSLDGGFTFGPGVLMYTDADCAGLHGHVKVAPDGTVYTPNKACGPATGAPFHDTVNDRQTLVFSEDNGITWHLSPIPDSTTNADRDPSVGIATDGTIYFGYQARDGHARIAVGHKTAPGVITWSPSYDVGAQLGIQNMAFAEVTAGDPDRAAFAFFGTTTPGAYDSAAFPGVWYLFIATTFDGGATWTTQNVTPNDPIQRGGICGGGTCRNLLDFFDITIDKEGRVLVAGEDGCLGGCIDGPPNSFTAKAFITRQTGGKRMFALYDPTEPALPGAPLVTGFRQPATVANLSWEMPDNGGEVITAYKVYRSLSGGAFTLLATVQETNFIDTSSDPTAAYRVTAVNMQGEGPFCSDFTPAIGAPPTACDAPGILVINDSLTDGQDNDFGANIPGDPRVNIRQLFIAEPFLGLGVNKLVFTFQVGPTTLGAAPASSQWYIIWNKLNPNTNFNRNWVGMKTDAAGTPRFEYGDFGVALDPLNPNPNGNKAVKVGDADSGSYDPATGVITITVSTSKLENIQPGQTMSGLFARTFLAKEESNEKAVQTAADTTDPSHYDLVGSAACQRLVPVVGAASRKTHTGVGPFDVMLPLTGNPGIECRTGGGTGSHTVVFTFANPLMNVGGATITNGPGSISSQSIQNEFEYVVNLTGVTNANYVTLKLTGITDTAGNATPELSVTMGVLDGDANADRFVDSADISQTKSQSGNGLDGGNFRVDFNIDGSVNSADISAVKSKSGTGLPTP